MDLEPTPGLSSASANNLKASIQGGSDEESSVAGWIVGGTGVGGLWRPDDRGGVADLHGGLLGGLHAELYGRDRNVHELAWIGHLLRSVARLRRHQHLRHLPDQLPERLRHLHQSLHRPESLRHELQQRPNHLPEPLRGASHDQLELLIT
jgi:hypothetical protein